MAMDFFQLECFCGIVQNKTFTEAAYTLSISQSSLSKQINKLEVELGAKLFFRNKHKVELTVVGQEFLPFARRVLEDYARMRNITRNYVQRTTLRLGSINYMGRNGLTGVIGSYLTAYPSTDITITTGDTLTLLKMLQEGALDMAFIAHVYSVDGKRSNTDGYPAGEYDDYMLIQDEYTLVTGMGHPFSGRDSISWPELEGEQFVLLDKSYSVYQYVIEAFQTYHISPQILFESDQVDTILGLVSTNKYVSVLSSRIATMYHGMHTLQLVPSMHRNTDLIIPKRSRHNPVVEDFLRFILKEFKL